MIQNLQQLIAARERQMGGKMLEDSEPNNQSSDDELKETMKLLFMYIKQAIGEITSDIDIIKQQQQEILKKLEDKTNQE